jgi:hypothetical protein
VQLITAPSEKVPGKQSNGTAVAAGHAVPAAHVLQTVSDVAPVAVEEVPPGQFSMDVVVGQ